LSVLPPGSYLGVEGENLCSLHMVLMGIR
jgi:hypothetical protein